jgi:hypothetical protein
MDVDGSQTRRSIGVVGKKLDTVVDFGRYLKTVDLQDTNAVVVDFLNVGDTSIITLLAYTPGGVPEIHER